MSNPWLRIPLGGTHTPPLFLSVQVARVDREEWIWDWNSRESVHLSSLKGRSQAGGQAPDAF